MREPLGVWSKVRKKIMKEKEGLIRPDQLIVDCLQILNNIFFLLSLLDWNFLEYLLEQSLSSDWISFTRDGGLCQYFQSIAGTLRAIQKGLVSD